MWKVSIDSRYRRTSFPWFLDAPRLASKESDGARSEQTVVVNNFDDGRGRKLVVLDPIFGFLNGKIDSNSDPKARQAFGPLAQLARRTGAAIVLVRHLNKKSDTSAMYRGGGSIAVTAQARSALLLGVHPEDPSTRVLTHVKGNLGPKPDSIGFVMETEEHYDAGSVSFPRWIGKIELSADDAAGCTNQQNNRRPTMTDAAVTFIKSMLADGKTVPAKELQDATIAATGVCKNTYWSAAKRAGVKRTRIGYGGAFLASLPTT